MPPRHGRKTTRRVTTRRRPARVARKQRKTVTGPFRSLVGADPFRPSMSVKMHYSENHLLSSGTLGVLGDEIVYYCNSLFDPLFNVGGHQPYAFDQMSLLYRKYKVNAILFELVWTDPSLDGVVLAATFQPPNGASPLTGKQAAFIKEQPFSITRSINNSGKQVGTIRQYFPIAKISGLTNLQFKADIDLFTANVTANPVATPFFRFAIGSDRGDTAATMIVKTKLTYFTTFYERKVLGSS